MYRGKRVDGKGWVKGCLIKETDGCVYILLEGAAVEHYYDNTGEVDHLYQVHCDSVGQSTGKQDKNDIDIYSDDIVREKVDRSYIAAQSFVNHEIDYVKWNKDTLSWWLVEQGEYLSDVDITELEVIGNTVDNSDLLGNQRKRTMTLYPVKNTHLKKPSEDSLALKKNGHPVRKNKNWKNG